MRLSSSKFNRLLNNFAQSFLYRKGYACPCIKPGSGQANYNCTHCLGKGRIWDASVLGLAGVIGRDAVKKQADFGLWDANDIMLSIPSDSPLYAMGMYDRVTAVNRTEPFSINFIDGVNAFLRFTPVSIDRVIWLDGADALIDGDIPTVNLDGSLTWTGVQPPAKTTYSLTGRRKPEYFCYQELPMDRPHFQGEPLPRRVVVRRFDLFGN